MNTPPLLLSAALLFWGWRCGLLWIAVLLAAALEGSRLVRVRWNLAQSDLDRIWNLCAVLFVGSAVLAFASSDGAVGGWLGADNRAARVAALAKSGRSMLLVLHWLPVTLFPIAAAQAFGPLQPMPWSTFSWWLRRLRRQAHSPRPTGGLNVTWSYGAATFIAASAGGQGQEFFFAGATALLAWALWANRPRAGSPVTWGACLLVVLGCSYGGQLGLVQLHGMLQRLDSALMNRLSGTSSADQSRTRIGSVGRLKLSGTIVLRLTTQSNTPAPALLREASFNLFKAPVWGSSRKEFHGVPSERDGTSWILRPDPRVTGSFTLATLFPGGDGILPVPLGVASLARLPVALETNRFGTVHAGSGPGYLEFETRYLDGPIHGSPPDDEDLIVPPEEQAAVDRVAAELNLEGQPPAQAAATIARFFSDHFRYSTWQPKNGRADLRRTALAAFLLEHRTGHCEYFGTATTLLLRRAGIPARYAVGYSVQEHKGNTYVVRQRHGHAWALAWIDQAWRDVDNTPPSWHQHDADRASFLEPLGDLWSRIRFGFAKWRWSETGIRQYLVWLVVPLVLLLAAQLFLKRQWSRARDKSGTGRPPPVWPGLDSDFYRIERQLAEAGLDRPPGEPLSIWWTRVKRVKPMAAAELDTAFALHHRLRFDPAGLTPAERETLRDAVTAWTARHAAGAVSQP